MIDFHDELEKRRPGIKAIIAELREAHPEWGLQLVEARAKELWQPTFHPERIATMSNAVDLVMVNGPANGRGSASQFPT